MLQMTLMSAHVIGTHTHHTKSSKCDCAVPHTSAKCFISATNVHVRGHMCRDSTHTPEIYNRDSLVVAISDKRRFIFIVRMPACVRQRYTRETKIHTT